jgi:O-antigen/teichoic acid export membrane protein
MMSAEMPPLASNWTRETNSTRNVLVGIGALALGSYLLLAITSRALSPHEYSMFAAFWSVVMGLILGAAAPLETFGLGTTSINEKKLKIDRQFVDAIQLVFLIVLIFILVLMPWSVHRVFDGNWTFLIATVLALVGFLFIHSARGLLIVEHRSSRYAQLMSLESLLRILMALLLMAVIGARGSSVALAVSIAALLIGALSYNSVSVHFELSARSNRLNIKNTGTFTPLLIASMATLVLLNLGPFVVQYLAGAQVAAAGVFLNALTISRIPIMLGPVLQLRLVPSVVAILSREKFPSLGMLIGKGLRTLIIGGVVFVVMFSLLGNMAIDALFGGTTILSHLDLALLALPTVLYLLAIAFQSILVTLTETKSIARSWSIGLGSYFLALLIPVDAILKVEIAGVLAMVVVVVLLIFHLKQAMSSRSVSNRMNKMDK